MVVPPLDHKLDIIDELSTQASKPASEIAAAVDISASEARDYLTSLDTFSYNNPVEAYVEEICERMLVNGPVTVDGDNYRLVRQYIDHHDTAVDTHPRQAPSH